VFCSDNIQHNNQAVQFATIFPRATVVALNAGMIFECHAALTNSGVDMLSNVGKATVFRLASYL